MQRLSKIEVDEVSLVDEAANERRFLLVKNAGGKPVSKTPEQILKEMKALLDGGAVPAAPAPAPAPDAVTKSDVEALIAKAREDGAKAAREEVTPVIEGLKKQVETLTASTAEAAKASKRSEITAHIKAKGWSGDLQKNVERAERMSAVLTKEDFEAWRDDQDRASAIAREPGLFGEVGKSTTSEEDAAVTEASRILDEASKAAAAKGADKKTTYAVMKAALGAKPGAYVANTKAQDRKARQQS